MIMRDFGRQINPMIHIPIIRIIIFLTLTIPMPISMTLIIIMRIKAVSKFFQLFIVGVYLDINIRMHP
jgi:hypothetical protein